MLQCVSCQKYNNLQSFFDLQVRWGKSKCGATVFRLVCWIAPLLILSKRWLFFSFSVCRFTGLSVVLQCPITRLYAP